MNEESRKCTDGPSFRAGIETQMQRMNVQTCGWGEGKGEMNPKARFYIYTLLCAKQTVSGNPLAQGAEFSAP